MIDTHCHLTFPDFQGRVTEELDYARKRGVTGAITISTTTAGALDCLKLACEHDNLWCSAGVHPLYAHEGPHLWENLKTVAEHPKCVAWGELGLDRHYDHPPFDTQLDVLHQQLEFIQKCERDGLAEGKWNKKSGPIIVHCRKAFDDLIPIFKNTGYDPSRFVFHCFTGGPEDARNVLDFGAMISFTGVVTYKNAPEVQEAAKLIPPDRIMVETDAPFLSPVPHRGKKPCRPGWVRDTAEFLAKLRGENFDLFHQQINDNTRRFFDIEVA